MTKRGRAATTFLGLLLGGAYLFAHDIADLEFVPNLDRFALSAAYRRGGEVERATRSRCCRFGADPNRGSA